MKSPLDLYISRRQSNIWTRQDRAWLQWCGSIMSGAQYATLLHFCAYAMPVNRL